MDAVYSSWKRGETPDWVAFHQIRELELRQSWRQAEQAYAAAKDRMAPSYELKALQEQMNKERRFYDIGNVVLKEVIYYSLHGHNSPDSLNGHNSPDFAGLDNSPLTLSH